MEPIFLVFFPSGGGKNFFIVDLSMLNKLAGLECKFDIFSSLKMVGKPRCCFLATVVNIIQIRNWKRGSGALVNYNS